MKLAHVEAVVRAFEAAGVRYLVAGGLAVNAHGVQRYTVDLDLVVQLQPDNVAAAFAALASLGYRPAVPVDSGMLADPVLRKRLVQEKGMVVLPFWSAQHQETPVDLFVTEPFDFATEYAAALVLALGPGLSMRIVGRDALIAMKEAVGRPQDRVDAAALRALVSAR